jgi:hypothetical protein
MSALMIARFGAASAKPPTPPAIAKPFGIRQLPNVVYCHREEMRTNGKQAPNEERAGVVTLGYGVEIRHKPVEVAIAIAITIAIAINDRLAWC